MTVTKPDLGHGISHPARYSKKVLAIMAEELEGYVKVLDPFAGTGLIHELAEFGHVTWGVEIEPEWADMHSNTFIGDATDLMFHNESFDAIAVSPTFGNRMADHHVAKDDSVRRSYTHDLGRTLHPNNSGQMQWGPAYCLLHKKAWKEAVRVLRPGGVFVLNVKDHIRKGERQKVSVWHLDTLLDLGLEVINMIPVPTRGFRVGENRDLRTLCEFVITLKKDLQPQAP